MITEKEIKELKGTRKVITIFSRVGTSQQRKFLLHWIKQGIN